MQVRQKKHIGSLHECFIANNIYQYCTFVEFKNEGLYTKGKVNVVVVPLWSKSCSSKTWCITHAAKLLYNNRCHSITID